MTSADNVPRFTSLSQSWCQKPNLIKATSIIVTKTFKGVIVAPVNVNSIGKSLQSELSGNYKQCQLMDKNGVFLYTRNHICNWAEELPWIRISNPQFLLNKGFLRRYFRTLITR